MKVFLLGKRKLSLLIVNRIHAFELLLTQLASRGSFTRQKLDVRAADIVGQQGIP